MIKRVFPISQIKAMGLYNAKHYDEIYSVELERVKRLLDVRRVVDKFACGLLINQIKQRNLHTMEYLQQFFARFFSSSEPTDNTPRKIIAFGNVLIDRTAHLSDTKLLERYQLKANTRGELGAELLEKITAEACEIVNCAANPGGSALNTVRLLKQLGTDATFFGAVGDDKNGEDLKYMLLQQGIQARLQIVSEAPTGQCICLITGDDSTLYANIGASAKFSIDFLKTMERDDTQTFLRPKQIVYIEGFFLPCRQEVCEYIVNNYIRERRRLALNLCGVYIVRGHFEQISFLARSAFFIFGNLSEFEAVADQMRCKTVESAIHSILEQYGTKVIAITKGADGVDLYTNFVDENSPAGPITFNSFKAPRVENIVDTTGAGDAFVAGFLHAWLEKRQLSECVRIATDVSAEVCTQVGCKLPS